MATGLAPSSAYPATAAAEIVKIGPQPGFQEKVLACSADILINGGGAGPGKTWALLMEAARNHANPRFGATIFRRTSPEITNQGGMWDESWDLYPKLGAKPNANDLKWEFPSGATVKFAHMQHEKDRKAYAGAQIAMIGFDQVEQFTEQQFWFMWSRNRSTCGVKPYIRATCNPVPADDPVGGWLHKLIQWWIDEETGQIIRSRDGVIRYFLRIEDEERIEWGDTKAELIKRFPGTDPDHILSFTFIEGSLEENKILKQVDPSYQAKLMALPKVEREQLLHRNWNARPTAGNVFNRAWFGIIDAIPSDPIDWVRYWDKAGTEDDGAYSAGVKLGFWSKGQKFIVAHVVRGQWSAHNRERVIEQTAKLDGSNVDVWIEQEPGSGGKESAANTIINLAGYAVHADKVTGDKYTRSKPLSAQVEAGNVLVLNAPWTEDFINELHNFDPNAGGFKDQVDAASGAFAKVSLHVKLELVNTEPTEAELEALKEDERTQFEDRVRQEGCVFPGEW